MHKKITSNFFGQKHTELFRPPISSDPQIIATIFSYMFSSFSISFQSFNTLLCYFRPNFNNAAHRTKITSFPAICHSSVYTFKGLINSFYQTITEVLQMHRGFLEHPSSHECSLCSCVQGCARGQTNKSWMDFSSSLSKDSGSSV